MERTKRAEVQRGKTPHPHLTVVLHCLQTNLQAARRLYAALNVVEKVDSRWLSSSTSWRNSGDRPGY